MHRLSQLSLQRKFYLEEQNWTIQRPTNICVCVNGIIHRSYVIYLIRGENLHLNVFLELYYNKIWTHNVITK